MSDKDKQILRDKVVAAMKISSEKLIAQKKALGQQIVISVKN